MGTTLEGKQINQTYQGLLKTTDNAEVSGTAKEITDGKGNGTGVTLDNAGNVTATSFTGDGSGLTNLPSDAVSSVNTQTGAVVLDTDDIGEGSTNQYFTTVRAVNAVTGGNLDMGSYDITTTGKIYFANVFSTEGDLPSASTYHGMFAHVHATGKAYFAHSGSWHKLLDEDSSNTDDLSEGSSNLYYTDARVSANSAVAANTAKTGITSTQASEIAANTLKTGITTQQADDIVANNSKVTRRPITAGGNTLETSESLTLTAGSNVTITEANGDVTIASSGTATNLSNTPATYTLDIESSSGTDTTLPAATVYLAGVMTAVDKTKLNAIESNADVTDATNVTAGLVAATSISTSDKATILANIGAGTGSGAVDSVNGATGVVVLDTDDISEGTTNLYYTDARVSANSAVTANTAKNSYPSADASKLSGIEAGAEVNPTNTDGLSEGSSNLYYTEARVSANTNVVANTAKISFDSASSTKLSGIEEGAEVNTVDSVNGATGTVSLDTADLTDVSTTAPSNGQVLQYNSTSSNYEPVTLSTTAPVDSVNSQTGTVVLDADDISDSATTNKFTTAANLTKLGNISVTQAVDLDTIESNVATNNAKVSMVLGTTAGTALEGDTALLQLGTTSTTALAGDTTTISAQQASDITANNAKVGITTQQASDITTNNAKVGITTQQAADISTNNSKVSMVLGTTAGTALEGDTVIPTNNNQLTNGAGYTTNTGTVTSVSSSTTNQLTVASGTSTPALSVVTGTVADAGTALATGDQIHTFVTGQGYITGNETVTLSGDITGSGTTAITASIANDAVGADQLANTAVTAGSYTAADITVDAQGRITAAANGSAGGGNEFASGLYIGGTAAINLLDDYEEGTYTPTFSFSYAGGLYPLAAKLGRYQKIGNTVLVDGYAQIQGFPNQTPTFNSVSLPFTVEKNYSSGYAVGLTNASWDQFDNDYFCRAKDNTTTLNFPSAANNNDTTTATTYTDYYIATLYFQIRYRTT